MPRNFPELRAQLDLLAQQVPTDAVILVRRDSHFAALATPLQFVVGCGRHLNCLLVSPAARSPTYGAALERALTLWREQGRQVFTLGPFAGDRLELSKVAIRPWATGEVRTTALPQLATALAERPQEQVWRYRLDELLPPTAP